MNKKLNEYNRKIFKILKNKYHHFQIGFFNSNNILFIGQNPGQPFNDTQRQQIKNLSNYNEYLKYEKKYTEQWKTSLFGEAIGKIIDNKWELISFTNLIKIPTIDNEIPSKQMIDQFMPIMQQQIKLLQPKIVVCVGKFVGKLFNLINFYDARKINDILYILIPHPSFLYRTNTFDKECINIKQIINI